jgi:KUP system potassium uptake protein
MWRDRLFGVMARNSQTVATFFDIPADRIVEIGTPVEI